MPRDWRKLRDRYGLFVVAIVLILVVPADAKEASWKWLVNRSDLIAIVGAYRLWSMKEHRSTLGKINGLGDALDNGIKTRLGSVEERLERIERALERRANGYDRATDRSRPEESRP